MKFFLLSPDAESVYDPPVWSLLRQIPNRVDSKGEADCILVPITRHPDFKFNENLSQLINGKPWVLVCFAEYNWDWDQKETHIWGVNTQKFFGDGYNTHWQAFDKFVQDHPPILTFKRELLEKDRSDKLLPIEYLNHLPESGNDPKDEYLKRPLDVLFNWGRSHEARMWLHGEIFQQAGVNGYDVITQWDHIEPAIKDNPKGFYWASIHAPHYGRLDVSKVQEFNQLSKVVISMPGAGVKTFRAGEMAQDALMAMPYDELAWAYPWTKDNSIQFFLPQAGRSYPSPVKVIRDTLMRPDLYELYGEAMANGRNYRPQEYLRRHVQANIEKFL